LGEKIKREGENRIWRERKRRKWGVSPTTKNFVLENEHTKKEVRV